MPDFLYQIKAKKDNDPEKNGAWDSRLIWPPLFTGVVSAADRKEAKRLVEDEYGRKFPTRVAAKDLASSEFLLRLTEITEKDGRSRKLLEIQECANCGSGFRVIDLYNYGNETYKGFDFCGSSCKAKHVERHSSIAFSSTFGAKHPTVIYEIRNKLTRRSYVGQTSQPFTLRWWQHFFRGGSCKFHEAIRNSSITDWTFSILETVDLTQRPERQSQLNFILGGEAFWIEKLNTIHSGYYTMGRSEPEDTTGSLISSALGPISPLTNCPSYDCTSGTAGECSPPS